MTRSEQERFADILHAIEPVGLRNVVVHEYFRVDAELILDIVDNQLGPLADRLRQL